MTTTPVVKLNKGAEETLDILRVRCGINREPKFIGHKPLADRLMVSDRTALRYLARLREAGLIERRNGQTRVLG